MIFSDSNDDASPSATTTAGDGGGGGADFNNNNNNKKKTPPPPPPPPPAGRLVGVGGAHNLASAAKYAAAQREARPSLFTPKLLKDAPP